MAIFLATSKLVVQSLIARTLLKQKQCKCARVTLALKSLMFDDLSLISSHFLCSCIDKWLVSCPKCPQCNARSKRSDVRVIYAKSISVVDTTDRDRALQDLENEKNVRISAQKAEAQAVLQYQLARAECDRLKEEIKTLKKQLECYSSAVKCEGGVGSEAGGDVECVEVSSDKQGRYEYCKTVNISQVSISS